MATPKKKQATKVEQFNEQADTAIRNKVATATVESALKSVSTAQASIGRTLANVGEQLQNELQELSDVRKGLELARNDAEALHGKDQLLRSIDELEAEFTARKEEIRLELEESERAMVEKLRADQRQADTELADYKHKAAQERLETTAKFEQEQHARALDERNRREALEKSWATREEALKLAEQELVSLRNKVAAFPQELKAAVTEASNAAASRVQKDFEHKMALLESESRSAANLAQARLDNATQRISELTAQVATAEARAIEASAKVADIAKQALDSASGQTTLSAIQNFAKPENAGAPRKA